MFYIVFFLFVRNCSVELGHYWMAKPVYETHVSNSKVHAFNHSPAMRGAASFLWCLFAPLVSYINGSIYICEEEIESSKG